jgi:alpha-D-xyloside xylohydrolase
MFGPSILVNPVAEEGATSRWLYLPPANAWYDFWTGDKLAGGRRVEAQAPLDRIPLYVRAGSILPLGPEVEYADQQSASPTELRIYPGADGGFTLYEDQGDTYAYEKGAHAVIPIRWDDKSATLTIAARQGAYPGMPAERTFRVLVVDGTKPGAAAKEVRYTGQEISISLK